MGIETERSNLGSAEILDNQLGEVFRGKEGDIEWAVPYINLPEGAESSRESITETISLLAKEYKVEDKYDFDKNPYNDSDPNVRGLAQAFLPSKENNGYHVVFNAIKGERSIPMQMRLIAHEFGHIKEDMEISGGNINGEDITRYLKEDSDFKQLQERIGKRFDKIISKSLPYRPFINTKDFYQNTMGEIIARIYAYQIFLEQLQQKPDLISKYKTFLQEKTQKGADSVEFNDFFSKEELAQLGLIVEDQQEYHEFLEIFNPEDLKWLDINYLRERFKNTTLPEKRRLGLTKSIDIDISDL